MFRDVPVFRCSWKYYMPFSEVSQFEKGFKSLEHFFLALCSNTKLFPINKDVYSVTTENPPLEEPGIIS